ncbi:hypothetical protein J6895_01819 [Nakaseomyces glabratus]|nr:hypothetical protein J6895_01819 [Nakaseomyces glabratus]
MANKSRPRRAAVPYRKYVGGQGYMQNVMLSRYKTTGKRVVDGEDDLSDEYYDGDEYDGNEKNTNKFGELKIIGAKTRRTDSVGNDILTESDDEGQDEESKTSKRKNRNKRLSSHGRKRSTNLSLEGLTIQDDEVECEPPMIPMKIPLEIQRRVVKYYFDLVEETEYEKENTEFENIMNVMLVSKYWYYLSLGRLYRAPKLSSRNFNAFVETITSAVTTTSMPGAGSKKIDRYRLGDLVQMLDLSTILQSGKNSNVSKLLRRCSNNLHAFTAPQTSFGYAPLISLKNCHKLRFLDLGLVSETVKLKDLFKAISNFNELTHLSFPRSSIDCEGFQEFCWPNNLQYLKLSGGITNEFVAMTNWPETITTLEFSFCPQVDEQSIYTVLAKIGHNLKHLSFFYPMPALRENSLDFIFRYCRNLLSVRLQVDYCSKWLFSEYILTPIEPDLPLEVRRQARPLRTIYLDCSGSLGLASKIHPDDFTIALLESRLPSLKNISVSSKLGWDMNGDDVADLLTAFEEQDGSLYVSY